MAVTFKQPYRLPQIFSRRRTDEACRETWINKRRGTSFRSIAADEWWHSQRVLCI